MEKRIYILLGCLVMLFALGLSGCKKHQHDAKVVEATSATCLKDGNIEYFYCEECDTYFKDQALTTIITKEETIIKGEHSYTATYSWSEDFLTCTGTLTCIYNKEEVIKETKESVVLETIDASCYATGIKIYQVDFDNELLEIQTKEEILPISHDYSSLCDEECNICDYERNTTTPHTVVNGSCEDCDYKEMILESIVINEDSNFLDSETGKIFLEEGMRLEFDLVGYNMYLVMEEMSEVIVYFGDTPILANEMIIEYSIDFLKLACEYEFLLQIADEIDDTYLGVSINGSEVYYSEYLYLMDMPHKIKITDYYVSLTNAAYTPQTKYYYLNETDEVKITINGEKLTNISNNIGTTYNDYFKLKINDVVIDLSKCIIGPMDISTTIEVKTANLIEYLGEQTTGTISIVYGYEEVFIDVVFTKEVMKDILKIKVTSFYIDKSYAGYDAVKGLTLLNDNPVLVQIGINNTELLKEFTSRNMALPIVLSFGFFSYAINENQFDIKYTSSGIEFHLDAKKLFFGIPVNNVKLGYSLYGGVDYTDVCGFNYNA